jgi:D-alanyl-D-alanine carboxypeptidase
LTRACRATAWLFCIASCPSAHRQPADSSPTTVDPAAPSDPAAHADAAGADGATTTTDATANAPYGPATQVLKYPCAAVLQSGRLGSFLASGDTRWAFADGDDWLALVNRSPTGALSPDYAPVDLIDFRDGSVRSAAECDGGRNCLRREAAAALIEMMDGMKAAGIPPHVQSAFRSFATQCWVFDSWAHSAPGGFCGATEQSALPGHSQHQLGTTVDLFTEDWLAQSRTIGASVFRDGFGCSAGGRWLDTHSWEFGFVAPYPIHPDERQDGSRCTPHSHRSTSINPMTGYKDEPWHLRFIGIDNAARYHDAWQASGPGSSVEITLEQWIRSKRGFVGDADVPVCDGCQCGACSTFSGSVDHTPCGQETLQLDTAGAVLPAGDVPHIVELKTVAAFEGTVEVDVTVRSAPHTPTQPPIFDDAGPAYGERQTYLALALRPAGAIHRYPDLPGAWRLAAEPIPAGATRWPWRASLAAPRLAREWNEANLVLPAKPGLTTIRLRIPASSARHVRFALLKGGVEEEVRDPF